jgi:UPF0755 protein
LRRAFALLILALLTLFFLAVVCVGALFILSGGDITGYVRTEYTRLMLRSQQRTLNQPIGSDATPIRFTIETGDTPRVVAGKLADAGLIADEELFVDYALVSGLDVQFEAGTYFVNQTQTIPEIALLLTDSSKSQFPFRILEGWRIEEVAAAIDDNPYFGFSGDEFLLVVRPGAAIDPAFAEQYGIPQGASLEGFLYPDTYQLPAEITPEMLRDTLLQTFSERVGTQIPADATRQNLSIYEIVTLASIIQREAIHADEHPMIASVYRNRLEIGMKLDADPTVQYGINGQRGRWWPQITQADYTNVSSPYNTYLVNGLPPGPIANPGISAIRAATYPAESSYFYFRAQCGGTGYHNFATTYEEQVANAC